MSLHFSKGYIVSCICLILGLYLCLDGLYAYYLKSTAIPIEALSPQNCKKGQYVYGDIDSYVLANYDTSNGKKYYGLSSSISFSPLGDSMDEYTIPIKDNGFIRFLAASEDTKNALADFIYVQQHPCHIEGQVIAIEIGLNEGFYDRCEQFRDTDYHDVVINDLCIQEISFDRRVGKGKKGIPFILISFAFFLLSGGRKNLVQVQKSDADADLTSKKVRYTRQTQYELEEERRHLSALYGRLDQLKRKCLYRLPLLLAGILMFIWADYALGKLMGIICLFLSLRAMIQYFLNSNMQAALFLVKHLHLKSVWMQIMESNKRIQILQRLIEENEAPNN